MKCVCGYEGECADTYEIISKPPRKKFIEIKGTFIIDEDYVRVYQTRIFACPKCHTLKMKS